MSMMSRVEQNIDSAISRLHARNKKEQNERAKQARNKEERNKRYRKVRPFLQLEANTMMRAYEKLIQDINKRSNVNNNTKKRVIGGFTAKKKSWANDMKHLGHLGA